MLRNILCWLVIMAGLGFNWQSVQGQYREPLFKIHDRGELWETMKDNGQIGGVFAPFEFYPSLDWPGGPADLPSKDEQRSYMQGAGVWIGGKNPDGSIFLNEMGPFTFVDLGTFYPLTETLNYIGSTGFNPHEAEEKITARWLTTNGLEFTRISRAWSEPAYNDFIIIEYRGENKSNKSLTDVYLGLSYLLRPSYQDALVHGFWGDNPNVDDELVGYDSTRQLFYAYDYYPNQSIAWDWGNYWDKRNELRTTGYAGFALLAADATKDGARQPKTIFHAQTINNSHRLTLASRSQTELYGILTGADRSLQAPADEVLSPFMLMGLGPYDLAPGATIKVVVAEAVNGIPLQQAIKGLSVQNQLPAGLDSLKRTVTRAQRLYQADYLPTALAPPAPDLEFFVLPTTQEIVFTWSPDYENWVDPLTGEKDLRMYRVYRSDRSFIGPYQKLKDIKIDGSTDRSRFFDDKLGKWKYKDNAIQVGVGYFYAVTAIDATNHESGMTNRNPSAMVTVRKPAENALNVKVFPNPFRLVSGLPTAGEESSIIFTNLPACCTIRIYTINGELVRTMQHDNPNSGEEVWNQLSDARQKTAAGMYFYTVTSEVGNAKGTLVLIK
ncbi:hypothetical protein L0128_02925 [candidate division KSB1 bacterium]|nr:hypothetical protein [candidate division KSB1 bacterium]